MNGRGEMQDDWGWGGGGGYLSVTVMGKNKS